MELYILDSLYRRVQTIDVFESLIWSERFSASGDFEFVISSTPAARGMLSKNTLLGSNFSYRVMYVDTVEDDVNEDGKAVLKVQGYELIAITDDRVWFQTSEGDGTIIPSASLFDTPLNLIKQLFYVVCYTGAIDPDDIISGITWDATLYPADTIEPPLDEVIVIQKPQSLYTSMKDIADIYDLGFRLYRNPNTNELYFNVYSGVDRTTQQTTVPAVVFAPNLENLQNTKEYSSYRGTKNVIYSYYTDTSTNISYNEIVYANPEDPEPTGLDRRVLFYNAPAPPTGTTDISAYLIQQGKDELARHRPVTIFDGELDQSTGYTYQVDYNLGDLVEIRNTDGVANKMRVTEQIFSSDASGDKSYPTLSLNLYINPGVWISWKYNKVWPDFDETEFWSNQQ